jgi:casein kinase II subunit beta
MAETWISQFCALLGHEYFAEVSEDFIEDDFNLTGLPAQVPMYKEALELILDVDPEEDEEDEEEEEEVSEDDDDGRGYRRSTRHMRMASDASVIESSAELLYGLIHQRYITSRPGIQQMLEKYELQHFGHCPRVNCAGAKVLPVGLSDTPGQDTVKLFCPSCLDIYTPPNSRFQTVDGAFFGTTFGCLFFMTFPELDISIPKVNASSSSTATDPGAPNLTIVESSRTSSLSNATTLKNSAVASSSTTPATPTATSAAKQLPPQPANINGIATGNLAPGLGAGRMYEPRIYGFRVSERARSGPRMKWLREKPVDINETDEVMRYGEEAAGEGEDIVPGAKSKPRTARGARSGRLRVNGAGSSTREGNGGSPMEVVGEGG